MLSLWSLDQIKRLRSFLGSSYKIDAPGRPNYSPAPNVASILAALPPSFLVHLLPPPPPFGRRRAAAVHRFPDSLARPLFPSPSISSLLSLVHLRCFDLLPSLSHLSPPLLPLALPSPAPCPVVPKTRWENALGRHAAAVHGLPLSLTHRFPHLFPSPSIVALISFLVFSPHLASSPRSLSSSSSSATACRALPVARRPRPCCAKDKVKSRTLPPTSSLPSPPQAPRATRLNIDIWTRARLYGIP